ncbi:DUF4193 family protein [Arthrobacter sp. JZ12]|uniref:DUF4193 domain-containing protein n=1 Tax=Arthrobacter sp. JZ12 TaxID=2654190 RepID=UPI002B492AFA|nr:DUF4193 domain-containing protein [Arthrobacter sp. JZ12]WRH25321.1 DUF4193 family protein [Arthrobacter sp. JZ12]
MATDEDEPRNKDDESSNESLEGIRARAAQKTQTALIDVDESDTAERIELPRADISHEELQVLVVQQQADEFTCSSCSLVKHRSQVARTSGARQYCKECEG